MINLAEQPLPTTRTDVLGGELKHEYECVRSKEGTKVFVHAKLSPTSTAAIFSPHRSWSYEKEANFPPETIVVSIPLTGTDDIEDLDEDLRMDEIVQRGPVPIMRESSYLPRSKSMLDDDDEDDTRSRKSSSSRVSFAEEVVSNVHTTPRYKREDVPDLFYSRKDIKMFKHAFRCGLICSDELTNEEEEAQSNGDYCITCY